jgi:hypothetical protein
MTRDCPVQFGERLEGKFLRPTQPVLHLKTEAQARRLQAHLGERLKQCHLETCLCS